MLTLTTAQYMALSNIAYTNFLNENVQDDGSGGDIGKTVTEMTGDLRGDITGKMRIDIKDPVNAPLQAIGEEWKLIACQNNNNDPISGFCGVAFQNTKTNEVVFAFRGTEPSSPGAYLGDLINDIQLIVPDQKLGVPKQFMDAEAFVTSTLQQANFTAEQRANLGEYVSFTGHSLGGANAEYMTLKTGWKSVTVNAPGIGQLFSLSKEQAKTFNSINYSHLKDGVGSLGIHIGEQLYVLAGDGGILPMSNHSSDLMVGCFDDNGYIKEELLANSSQAEFFTDFVSNLAKEDLSLLQLACLTMAATGKGVEMMAANVLKNGEIQFSRAEWERKLAESFIVGMRGVADETGNDNLKSWMSYSEGKIAESAAMSDIVVWLQGMLDMTYKYVCGALSDIDLLSNAAIAGRIQSVDVGRAAAADGRLLNAALLAAGSEIFNSATLLIPRRVDPLVLDLDGNGIETRNLASGAFFDFDKNGLAEQTAWFGKTDGIINAVGEYLFRRNTANTVEDTLTKVL